MGKTRHAWTGANIQAFRRALGENVATFGERFARSGRTVEDWEQDRSRPDPLAIRELERLKQKALDNLTAVP